MKQLTHKYVLIAILLGLVFHGTSIFFTLETTYDALIHVFFAEHYSSNWFETWNFKWYTGFTVMSYPPLVHQGMALIGMIGGLKFGLFAMALISIVLFTTGVYRFSYLITSSYRAAGFSAIFAVFSTSFVETLHVFGQLPSIIGISMLMHALPEIYKWLRSGHLKHLILALSLIAVTVTSHHVTPIFGMVFFIFPLIGMAIMDTARTNVETMKDITFPIFLKTFFRLFKRIVGFGLSSLVIIILGILPYWINSKNNPITQVPIPHGSRDNFLEITSSGLVFFLIPWGILLLLLPYIFYSKRYLFFGLSFPLLFVLGTGGTTPIPRLMLGETAFNILTLDRFTLWASIMALPIIGEFILRFTQGDLKMLLQSKIGRKQLNTVGFILASLAVAMTIFTMSLGYFRPSQPQKIKMLPIVNFLNQDDHDQWRYLTLGFGDQMAWLSAQTKALTVDGNYHSARRLPELTTRPIERLENSKFKGVAGIGSLQQFLTTPEKYNLKYIFSNDKFYDPILFFCGWQRLQQLENGIQVWERLNVAPISSILPKEEPAKWQKLHWGIVPTSTVVILFILLFRYNFQVGKKDQEYPELKSTLGKFKDKLLVVNVGWSIVVFVLFFYGMYQFYIKNDAHRSPENAIMAYYDALDFKEFEKAYQLIDPNSQVDINQYMLEISVSDGLLSSYAKLDEIDVEITSLSDDIATVRVNSHWITPLERIDRTDYKSLVRSEGNWYIVPEELDTDLPPDQLYSNNTTGFFNQGRRRITTEQTYHEDVLKQPVLEILSAKLVKSNEQYAIVGEVQNIDNVPADVVIKGTLYNDQDEELASYNAKYHMKHKLMPKEITAFRINFEGIAWTNIKDSIPNTFNPDEFTPIALKEQPTKFNIQAAGNVSGSDLYKDLVINRVEISDHHVEGSLFNSGLEEITVPQLLINYYDSNGSLLWVDHMFLKEGIRQQRKRAFSYTLLKDHSVEIISDDMQNIFVNGLPNASISNKIVPNRIENHSISELQALDNPNFNYIKIESNAFIGNPNL